MITVGDLLIEYREAASCNDLPVLTLTERNGFIRQSDRFRKRLAVADTSKYRVVRRGDFAFNPYLLWAGAIAQNTVVEAGIVSPLYPTFRVRRGFDDRYVARLLLSPQVVALYDHIAFGSVPRRRRSAVADFLALPIPRPPNLDEQRRIANVLEHVSHIQIRRREVIKRYRAMTKSIATETFGGEAGVRVRLGDVAEIASGITKGRKITGPTSIVPYLAVANVQAEELNLSVIKSIEATDVEIRRYALQRGDLVLTEGGDPDKLGRGTVWRGELPICLHQNHIFRVRCRPGSSLLPDYLAAWVASRESRDFFLSCAKQTTGIASINASQLKSLSVKLVPLQLQREYVGRLHAVSHQHAVALRAVSAADELFASLQYRAFNGEL